MASYHYNTNISTRGNGGSVAGVAAYIFGEKLRDSYDGKIHDRSYRQDVIFREIILPPEAPRELLDRQTLLDRLNDSERRSDSQMARTIKFSLPNELYERSVEECIALAKEFALENFVSLNLCTGIAIHEGLLDESKKPASIEAINERQNNPHAHLLVPFRGIDRNGFQKTKTQTRYLNSKSYLIHSRKEWARLQNREFER
jgi:hypothetical protein